MNITPHIIPNTYTPRPPGSNIVGFALPAAVSGLWLGVLKNALHGMHGSLQKPRDPKFHSVSSMIYRLEDYDFPLTPVLILSALVHPSCKAITKT